MKRHWHNNGRHATCLPTSSPWTISPPPWSMQASSTQTQCPLVTLHHHTRHTDSYINITLRAQTAVTGRTHLAVSWKLNWKLNAFMLLLTTRVTLITVITTIIILIITAERQIIVNKCTEWSLTTHTHTYTQARQLLYQQPHSTINQSINQSIKMNSYSAICCKHIRGRTYRYTKHDSPRPRLTTFTRWRHQLFDPATSEFDPKFYGVLNVLWQQL